jgi:hypothetical protein
MGIYNIQACDKHYLCHDKDVFSFTHWCAHSFLSMRDIIHKHSRIDLFLCMRFIG